MGSFLELCSVKVQSAWSLIQKALKQYNLYKLALKLGWKEPPKMICGVKITCFNWHWPCRRHMWTPVPLSPRSSGRGLWISWSQPASWRFSAETEFSGVHAPCCWIDDKMTSTTYRDWNGISQTDKVKKITYAAIKNKQDEKQLQNITLSESLCASFLSTIQIPQFIVLIKMLSDKTPLRRCPYRAHMISEILLS